MAEKLPASQIITKSVDWLRDGGYLKDDIRGFAGRTKAWKKSGHVYVYVMQVEDKKVRTGPEWRPFAYKKRMSKEQLSHEYWVNPDERFAYEVVIGKEMTDMTVSSLIKLLQKYPSDMVVQRAEELFAEQEQWTEAADIKTVKVVNGKLLIH